PTAVGHFGDAVLEECFCLICFALLFADEVNEAIANAVVEKRANVAFRLIDVLIGAPESDNAFRVQFILQVMRNAEAMNLGMNASFIWREDRYKLILHVISSSLLVVVKGRIEERVGGCMEGNFLKGFEKGVLK